MNLTARCTNISSLMITRLTIVGLSSSSVKALGYGLDGPGPITGIGRLEIFLYSFVSRLVLSMGGSPRELNEEFVT